MLNVRLDSVKSRCLKASVLYDTHLQFPQRNRLGQWSRWEITCRGRLSSESLLVPRLEIELISVDLGARTRPFINSNIISIGHKQTGNKTGITGRN